MNNTEMKEHLLNLMLEGDSSIRSPYGLYGHPSMWNLLTEGGIITAIRPATAQERVGHKWVEVSGICWGRHKDGEWIAGEQHQVSTFDWFVGRELFPALQRGADLCKIVPREEVPSP